jgi:hypothetical protein
MQARVYYNLHRHTFSIQHRIDGRWLVRGYADEVMLRDVTFKVSEGGRQRVIREGRKNVHAYVRGTLVDQTPATPVAATYNPYKYESFVEKDTGAPIYSARFARLVSKQIQIAKEI